MGELSFREATDDDIPAILETLRAALGETPLLRRTPELWAWKHTDNPFGRSLVLVASAGERIAGVRAMMRWVLQASDGEKLRCLRAVDTATHPDFARRGIFRELTMSAVGIARDEDVHLLFNTPNVQSAPGYLHMGWETVARLGVLVRPRLGPAVRLEREAPPSRRKIAPGLSPIEAMPQHPPERVPLGLRTPRRPDYLKWRFQAHPTAQYGWLGNSSHQAGVVARASVRGSRSELVISDLLGSPAPSLIRRVSRATRARYLAGWFSPGTPERRAAVRGGMVPIPGLRTLRLIALPLADLGIDVHDLGSWDLATSDLELL